MPQCSVSSCDRPAKTNGWCQAHYMRWWSTGDLREAVPLRRYGQTPSERLWAAVQRKGADECWPYTGAVGARGYGQVKVAGRSYYAHRVAYEDAVGPIPAGTQLDHLCHTRDKDCPGGWSCPHRRCVNPAHLEPVTPSENVVRGRAPEKVRARAATITHCPRGHEKVKGKRWCPECARSRARARSLKNQGLPDPRRISAETVAQVQELLAVGRSHSQIAAATGVSLATISRIRTGGSWFSHP